MFATAKLLVKLTIRPTYIEGKAPLATARSANLRVDDVHMFVRPSICLSSKLSNLVLWSLLT